MKRSSEYLRDLLNELNDVAAFTANGRGSFVNDHKTQKATIRCYEVIGEIAKRLPESIRLTNPQIDWRKLIGFRDFLAHNYEDIILEFVWQAVEDLPNLRAAVLALFNSMKNSDKEPPG